jgi:membrane-bound lytic murein transglycosylase D
MRPADVAKQVGMSEALLREVNHIPPRMLVKAGSTLLVPREESRAADVSEHIAENATMALVSDGPALRRVSLRAGKKDSVASIARRYHLNTEQVAEWNKVGTTASFRPGQTVHVYLASSARHGVSPNRKTAAKPTRMAHAKTPVRAAKVAKADTAPARPAANGE